MYLQMNTSGTLSCALIDVYMRLRMLSTKEWLNLVVCLLIPI